MKMKQKVLPLIKIAFFVGAMTATALKFNERLFLLAPEVPTLAILYLLFQCGCQMSYLAGIFFLHGAKAKPCLCLWSIVVAGVILSYTAIRFFTHAPAWYFGSAAFLAGGIFGITMVSCFILSRTERERVERCMALVISSDSLTRRM
jgi:hypothetical protein